MTNGDFIRSMTDDDIRENLTPGICELIKHRDPERCQNREHCFHCVKDWLKEKNKIMVRADKWFRTAERASLEFFHLFSPLYCSYCSFIPVYNC
jgi:hypothetical protein